jgi:DegV family protein with EDD domain
MVVCDSGCDISAELAAKYDIRIISLGINYRAKTFTDIQLEKDDPLYVYKHFKEEVPHTASLNMADVLDVLEKGYADGYRNVIGITISGAMSSTFNVMRNALDEYSDEHPEARTFAFDTKNISFGSGVFAVYAALKLAQGASFDNTVESLKKKIYDSHLAFYMDTLDYLR